MSLILLILCEKSSRRLSN